MVQNGASKKEEAVNCVTPPAFIYPFFRGSVNLPTEEKWSYTVLRQE